MTLNVLICRSDGTQEITAREVPDDYFASMAPTQAEQAEGTEQA